MKGRPLPVRCKYCRNNLLAFDTTAWFGGIWKKADQAKLCPYCDKVQRRG